MDAMSSASCVSPPTVCDCDCGCACINPKPNASPVLRCLGGGRRIRRAACAAAERRWCIEEKGVRGAHPGLQRKRSQPRPAADVAMQTSPGPTDNGGHADQVRRVRGEGKGKLGGCASRIARRYALAPIYIHAYTNTHARA